MKSFNLRNLAFTLHRYIGLTLGLLIAFVGLTGSFLVFKPEIAKFLVTQQVGTIVPQEQMVSIDAVLETAKAVSNNRSDLKLDTIRLPATPDLPYEVAFFDATDQLTRIFIHPYTGAVIGRNESDSSFERIVLKLHYGLLLGRNGEIIIGIAGLLLFILCVTGLILWSGWRKLITGFKIKWNGHPKRVNFDIHKVAGIVTAIFLAFTAFTGFCWNFSDWSYPIIYAATFTAQPSKVISKPIPNQAPLKLSQLLQISQTIFPEAETFSVGIPSTEEAAVYISKRQNPKLMFYGDSGVYLDQYNGEILRVVDSRKLPLADALLSAFEYLHYGTFWGLSSRVFYVFVGLSPTILLITGFFMYQYRYKKIKNYIQ
ncbi:PepSY domain-containing protein [Tolypothrix sp. PCC 7910]|uniref:PepSY-associated TM helix domain-containing protein n=1 Tax=Tolypothrix sp. PCC 7910 TaxID=2099387 RepID=UPI0014279D11|nr:PepSY-associated TM helix domain-containing protein [Tolypothrix sp. PCC 7910]QIR40553.1 PepSY domain-containing protein [Tolypothrix sp. PCC 7910]